MQLDAPHILVVDDDTRLCDLLRTYLSDHGYRVTTVHDAAAARAKLEGPRFDLLILDIMMPGESGVDLTKGLSRTLRAPILLLSAMSEPEQRITGLESGADDYLTKPFEPRELLLRIAGLLRRTPPSPTKLPPIKLGDFTFDLDREELRRDGELVRLTTAETELLKVFALNSGMTLSREELGRRIRFGGTGRAIDVQITRLRRKIEPDPKLPRYLQTVWGEGYTLLPD